ncbi:MAG TPA: DHA2 family efflux MFS transporter permease subunit [Nocardioides sp.]|uniref:DHA2 family efflux MFS transporter permease subunit n=1 Tax=Nocardioides sp. TaxID=35761 RepID=UPI002BEECF6B|nr:DHA2 family efflux MFS transporter permease subunit [Nocardioides sp.]HTW16266.1 DHA2 family efflux MFS transporter permease subunit [Nocardioides sp.]
MTTAPSTSPPSPSADSDKLDRGVLLVAGVVVLGAIMSILDITVVSVALKTFEAEFGATTAQVAWTMTAYTLALASVIPLTGWASDRFGTKRLYLTAIALFAAGSALCAVATSLEMLVAFRVLQGFGGGMLVPLGMTILTRAAGTERVGRVMAVMGIPMLLGPIAGPILGGALIDNASWHWIFLINVPIGIVALVYSAKVLPADDPTPSETFDWLGMVLLSPGLALFLYGVSTIPETGSAWHAKVLVPAVIGLVLIVAFVPWALSRRNAHPLVDLRLFANRTLTFAVIAMSLFAIAFFGASLLFPQYYIGVRGESAMMAGLLLAPQGIGAMLTMPVAGVLSDKIGPGKIVLAGVATITVGLGLYATLDDTTSYWFLGLALFIQGLGMGATMMPIMSAALQTLREHTIARGSTLMNIIQQVAASIGTAIFSVLLTNGIKNDVGPTDPVGDLADVFGNVFTVATVMVLLVLIPAFFLPRKKAEHAVDPTLLAGH